MGRRLRVVIRMRVGPERPVFITARTRDAFTIFAGSPREDLLATLIPAGFSASRNGKLQIPTAWGLNFSSSCCRLSAAIHPRALEPHQSFLAGPAIPGDS